jgi:prepilin-type N-terminal cleavage/methylation domain-containing protein
MRTSTSRRSLPNHCYAAFTLIEMLVSIAVMAVLVTGIASAIVLATRTAEGAAQPGDLADAAGVVDQITAELAVALSFSERTATAVTFTVPDRDGDEAPETIRYAWSGVAGDPLTRAYKGGEAQAIAQDVQQFNLTYLVKSLAPPAE